jgi:AcrR family transcriptional regulator
MKEFSEKQIQIMEAAEVLFSEKGFEGTSVRDIAESADVNLAMISYYFGSKDKLMEALFTYRGDNSLALLKSMLEKKELSSLEKFNQLIDHYIERFQNKYCFHRILTREQMANVKGPVSDLILALKRNNLEFIRQLVTEGQKRKEFRRNVDISLMMSTLVGTVNHILSTKHYYRELNGLQSLSEDQFDRHIRKKLSLHLKSIFKATLTHE